MAPLPNNNTNVLYIDYAANGREHTAQFRYAGPAAPPSASFLEGIDDLLIECNPFMPTNWTFIGWRYRAVGTNFSIPITGSPTAFAGTGVANVTEAPGFIGVPGRSEGGRRNRFYLLGSSYTPVGEGSTAGDYRTNAAEDPLVGDLLAALSAADLVAIDGLQTNWKPYMNLGYNAYWQRAVRG